ncbi:hypothetical protein [uncultured Lacinutrix sp.]|uniref:hypothetical protein n=1 Tax=uncultured Lacinutrix sp. TaxID=574032 RepID=UPI00260FB254|nr:hypothetical protein [uncultured Lacinutrix sp.]
MSNETIIWFFNILVYGFCYSSVLSYILSLFKSKKVKLLNDSFYNYSIKTIRIIAIFYFFYYLFSTIYFYSTEENTFFSNRATGPYWWAYWIMLLRPFIFCLLIQLFWFKRFQRKNFLNFILILIIFIIVLASGPNLERYIIFITSWHRDYAPNNFEIDGVEYNLVFILFLGIIERLLIYSGLVFLVRFISLRANK